MPRALFLSLLLSLLASPGLATDLVVGGEFAVEWDDNVLSRSDGELEDFTLRYGPRVELVDGEGRFRWRARYNPDYQDFVDLDDLDGWDHDARIDLDWDITQNTSIHFHDQYIDVARFTRLSGTDPVLDVPLISLGRLGLKQNRAELGIEHALGARHLLRFDLSNTDSDFEGDRADTNFSLARLNYTYVYTPRTRIGWIASVQQQKVDRVEADTTETNYYNLSLQWIHDFDPTLSLSISAGPAFVDRSARSTDVVLENAFLYPVQRAPGVVGPVAVSTCPTLDDGTPFLAVECEEIPLSSFSDPSFVNETTDVPLVGGFPDEVTSDVTYFASVSLSKRWTPYLETVLRYNRSAVTTGGQGGEVRDIVFGSIQWRPVRRMRVVFTASWENREQATDGVSFVRSLSADTVQGVSDVGRQAGLRALSVDRDIRNVRYTASISARYQLTEQLALFSRIFWYEQEIKDTALPTRTTTRLRVVVGLNYFFEPIGLPI